MSKETEPHPLEQFILPRRLERMDKVLSARTSQLTVVLDRIHHEHNISAVIRSADAFGIQDVYFTGKRFKGSSGISLGAEKWVDVHCFEEEADLIEALRKKSYKLVALEPAEYSGELPAMRVHELPFNERLALVFGNEKRGLSCGLKNACDLSASIEMHGFVESFNISVACALCLYTARLANSQTDQASMSNEALLGGLEATRKETIRSKWLEADLPEGKKVMAELDRRNDSG